MGRAINKLSAMKVNRLDEPGYYGDGAGLYLQISPFRTKSWIFKYTLNGRSREMGLGSIHDFTLAEARELAMAQRKLLKEKIDPIEARDAKNQARLLEAAKRITFDECVEKYIDTHRTGWKNAKHIEQWENSLATYARPNIGKLSVADIDTGLVLKCLEPIWSTKTETATRVRGRIEKVLDWATTRGYRQGENPARWKGHLEHNLPTPNRISKVVHHPALPFIEVGSFVQALRQRSGSAASALELAILTAVRSGEVRGATWSEIDMDRGIWTIPSERMKMKTEHRVPLSKRALEILEKMKAVAESTAPTSLVFPSPRGKKLSDMTLTAVIRRMNEGDAPKWIDPKTGAQVVPHGFRSSFRDWAAEDTNYPRWLAEKALAHLVGDETERAYQRGDLLEKRRQLMEDWATYCNTEHKPREVVQIMSSAAA
ncbi:MAG TPA: tyrosine-type recombinase/integrase [Noviherbaspirillum sp.]|nr:tyrosine-type recombinase/integrase [Noviherbaspirillum sp.]